MLGWLSAVFAFSLLRVPALPPGFASRTPREKLLLVAAGSAAAAAPMLAAAVPDEGAGVAALSLLARTAASTSVSMGVAYSAVCAGFSPEPGAFAVAFSATAAFCLFRRGARR